MKNIKNLFYFWSTLVIIVAHQPSVTYAQSDHYDPYSPDHIDTMSYYYYSGTSGLIESDLRDELHFIIKNGHTAVSYASLWQHFKILDKKPNGTVWDIYSDIPGQTPTYIFQFGDDQCGNYSNEGDCYNREHSWPRSYFNGAVAPMNTDLHHIYPTDGWVNGIRGNHPYGVVSNPTKISSNGSKVGTGDPIANYGGYGGNGTLYFEPIDEYKGDLARTYFYWAVRYYGQDSGWRSDFGNADGAALRPWTIKMLLDWHRMDPVSEKEINRNNGIYTIQGNRNPFVDYPLFVECIWGDHELCDTTNPIFINEMEQFEWQLFPNPTTHYIYIGTTSKPQSNIEVQLYSIDGKYIPIMAEREYDTQWILNLENLESGMYFINIVTEQINIQRKFVKL